MCGITGLFQLDNAPASRELLGRMNDSITHRGPDEDGLWTHGAVGLAMRRLAIIDLACGQQPLSNEDDSIWIVFNGEIYNHPELRADLETRGHKFKTHSDTEAIVHAYEEWGRDCPNHLRGMFAFAIYDIKAETLFLARDRVGKKPLLYTTQNNRFLFASEFAAILSDPEVARKPNARALDLFMATGCISAPHTGYEGIHKLPPAHSLTLCKGAIKIERYWSLDEHFAPSKKLQISEDDAARELLERLEEAIKIRLMSEVPLGAFLSGGIDSSAVVALMSRLSSTPVKTFSIGFEESEFSEVHHARRLAEKYQTDHTEVIVQPDAASILPLLVRHFGEPYADSSAVPTYYVSQATRQHVTVALNGDGGDEVFGGYDRYRAMQWTQNTPRALLQLGRAAARALPRGGNFRSRPARIKRMLQAAVLPAPQRYLQWTSLWNRAQKNELYTRAWKEECGWKQPHPVEQWMAGGADLDIIDACLLCDTNTYLPDDLLPKVDITSMACSLEARSPFLDHHLIEWAATLPSNFKMRGSTGKYILRHALRDLVPQENMARNKMGFGVPIGEWFRGPLKPLLHDVVLSDQALSRGYFKPDVVRRLAREHDAKEVDHGFRLWSLLMLEMWHREFIDG